MKSKLTLVPLLWVVACEFEVQRYVLPDGRDDRPITAAINERNNELIIFRGLGFGGPFPPTPMSHTVYTLDLTAAPVDRQWQKRSTDVAVPAPWFTSTRGFIEIEDRYYLACDDSNTNVVYSFDPDTYTFEVLSTSTLGPEYNASDCCAVGVTFDASGSTVNTGGSVNGEERIYILGGRHGFESPTALVRYYSITNDSWGLASDLNVGRSHLGCVTAQDEGQPQIYAIGGSNGPAGEALDSMELYDVQADEWTLYEDYLSVGRMRLGVQNVDDRYLILIGGDAGCVSGGNSCAGDHSLSLVELIDIRNGNRLLSPDTYPIPQLKTARQTPGTVLRKRNGPDGERYELYVIGGRMTDETGSGVSVDTEVFRFGRVPVGLLRGR